MASQIKWLDRKFKLDWPVGYLPIFENRLAGVVPRIELMIKDVPNDLLEFKPKGEWSVKEHIGHLIDLEKLHHNRILQLKKFVDVLYPADMSNAATKAANHNSKIASELIRELDQARKHFLTEVRSLNDDHLNHSALHERLGKQMSPVSVCFFCAEHDDHHLAIMQRILNKNQ